MASSFTSKNHLSCSKACLSLVQKLKRLDFDKNMLFLMHSCFKMDRDSVFIVP